MQFVLQVRLIPQIYMTYCAVATLFAVYPSISRSIIMESIISYLARCPIKKEGLSGRESF